VLKCYIFVTCVVDFILVTVVYPLINVNIHFLFMLLKWHSKTDLQLA